MTYIALAPASDIPKGRYIRCEIDGISLLASWFADEVHVVRDLCSHRSNPLCGGRLMGHVLSCPMHGGEFSFLTGEALSFPAMKPIAHYNTRRVGDMIELDWPAPEDTILLKND